MLPPGLGFNILSDRAIAASRSARLPRSYWNWDPMIRENERGFFPYTEKFRKAIREGLRIPLGSCRPSRCAGDFWDMGTCVHGVPVYRWGGAAGSRWRG